MLPGTELLGASLVAVATVAGVWLARRRARQQRIWFATSAGALLIVACLHLVPQCLGSCSRRFGVATIGADCRGCGVLLALLEN